MNQPRPLTLIILGSLTVIFIVAAIFIFRNTPDTPTPNIVVELPVGEVPRAIRLTTSEKGMVVLSANQLQITSLLYDDFSASSLSLTLDGNPIPFTVIGEGDEAKLYFYADGITNTLSAPPVYWLTTSESDPMATLSASVSNASQTNTGHQTNRWENNNIFLAQAEGADLWLGDQLLAGGSIDISLDGIRPTGGPGQLTVRIWANNQAPPNPDHHVDLILNGEKIDEVYWDGIIEKTIVVEVNAGILQTTNNILTINAPGDTGAPGEQLFIDWVELAYESELDASQTPLIFDSDAGAIQVNGTTEDALVFNITDPQNPILLTNTEAERGELSFAGDGLDNRYAVLNPDQAIAPAISLVREWDSLTNDGRGADYVAIVAGITGFDEALQPLLDHRQAQGLQVQSIPVTQIYDEFGHGRQTPQAIRDFLQYANENWTPAPHFVLLVGDASFDPYNHMNGQNQDLLPTYLVNSHFAGYVASDTWYTLLDDNTLSPSLAIGRFPAQTNNQLRTMVEKTIAYETNTDPNWTNQALLVADDEPDFDNASDLLASDLVTTGYDLEKIYMSQNDETEFNNNAIINAINSGVGIINYVGHGSLDLWGDEKVFQASDAGELSNTNSFPIFTTFTCLNGYFNHPQVDTISETLLWQENGGVVAAVAPSGRTTTRQQTPIADQFYAALLTGEVDTLGEALQIAKIAGSNNPDLEDVIHTFNLLGDPALRFQLPPQS